MSRNAHFALHGSLATAYAPDAERSAEGDILGVSAYDLAGLREDDAAVRLGVSAYDLAGLREDDAAVRLGVSAYDLAGLREDDADVRMGVSAYDLSGLREDDAAVRLGLTDFDGATGDAEGSAEGHAVAQLGGILVSNGRMGGMVEDHYDISLEGLREDDADVRLGVSAYDLSGLREDDAAVRLGEYGNRYGARFIWNGQYNRGNHYGTTYPRGLRRRVRLIKTKMGTAYVEDATGSAEDPSGRAGMGDIDSLNAEAGGRGMGAITSRFRMGYILRGLREDDASIRMGVSAYDLAGLREDDAAVRLGVSAYDMGRRRAFQYSVDGAEQYPPAMLAAEGFHERFPVRLNGLGRIYMGAMTWSEAMPRIQTAIQQEASLMARILKLPEVARGALLSQIASLNNADGRKGQLFHAWGEARWNNSMLNTYLIEGEPGWLEHAGRERRLKDTEIVIPTADQMVTAYERGATPNQAINAAINDVNKRIDGLKGGFMDYALPIGAGVVGAGALTALVLALSK